MFLIHRLNHQWLWAVEFIELSQCCGCVAIIQITLQQDLTHLRVKCDTTAIAAAHDFDILPSGSVPVTQRWTSLLILITKMPNHQGGTQIKLYLREMKKIWLLNCLPLTTHSVQIQISKHCTHSTLTTIACTQRNYFGLSKNISPIISFSCPLSLPQDFKKS